MKKKIFNTICIILKQVPDDKKNLKMKHKRKVWTIKRKEESKHSKTCPTTKPLNS